MGTLQQEENFAKLSPAQQQAIASQLLMKQQMAQHQQMAQQQLAQAAAAQQAAAAAAVASKLSPRSDDGLTSSSAWSAPTTSAPQPHSGSKLTIMHVRCALISTQQMAAMFSLSQKACFV